MSSPKDWVELAKKFGATDAKIIDAGSVVTAAWVQMKCRYGCEHYNTSPCCPPATPSYKETQEIIRCYHTALLIQSHSLAMHELLLKLERELFLAGYYKALSFGAGSCPLCHVCNREKCRQPQKARPSMEACGIDVFGTVKANGFTLQVLDDPNADPNCFSLILIE